MAPFIFVIGLSFGTAAANSGPVQSATCILARLDATAAEKLASEGTILIESGGFSPGAGALLTPAPSCMAIHHWTATQTQLVGRYTIARLGLPSATAALRLGGIDPAKLTAIYRNLSAQTRARPLSRQDSAALLAKAQAAGLVRSDADLPKMGRYIGLLNLIDAIPAMLD